MAPKRRRERDRPKAGPEAPYNPNKRVLLSYGSDDDEPEDTTAPTEAPMLDERAVATYQMDEYPASDNEQSNLPDSNAAATKEEADSGGVEHDQDEKDMLNESAAITQRTTASGSWRNKAQKDHDTDQFPALGALEDGEEDYDSSTEEAMAYLHAVREERWAMPEVLAAPRQVRDNDTAIADDADEERAEENIPDESQETDPQRVFTKSLKEKFYTQRTQLHLPPSAEKLTELGDQHPISFPQGNTKAYAEWHRLLSSKAPMPAQLRSIDQETVFNLLALLREHYLVKGKNIKNVTSAWLWSLLARLDDVGTMDNDQVYPIRELGKKVIFLQLHFDDPEAAAQLEQIQQQDIGPVDSPETTGGAEDHAQEDLNATNASRLERTSSHTKTYHASASDNTLATLDMLLVVVGEVFGQRDLLEFRKPWVLKPSAVGASVD